MSSLGSSLGSCIYHEHTSGGDYHLLIYKYPKNQTFHEFARDIHMEHCYSYETKDTYCLKCQLYHRDRKLCRDKNLKLNQQKRLYLPHILSEYFEDYSGHHWTKLSNLLKIWINGACFVVNNGNSTLLCLMDDQNYYCVDWYGS